jgi:hypothetical protein
MRKLLLIAALALSLGSTEMRAAPVLAEKNSGMDHVVAADRTDDTLPILDFGQVSIGQSITQELTVGNAGTAVLTVCSITTNPLFSVDSPTGSFTVLPGDLLGVIQAQLLEGHNVLHEFACVTRRPRGARDQQNRW